MKLRLQQKLKSQQGASILMALFLFLVCATLAAVILAAGTAAAGRAAGLAETDQKYYSVTSAAELFREMMGGDDGVSAAIVCTKKTVTTRVNGVVTGTTESDPTCTIGGAAVSSGNETMSSYAEDAALRLLNAGKGMASMGAYAWDWQFGTVSSTAALKTSDLKFSHSASGLSSAQKALIDGVTIRMTLQENGTIVTRFTNGGTNQTYSVELVCKPQVDTQTESSTSTSTSGSTVTQTKIETKTTTLTWKAEEMKRASGSGTTGGGA